MAMKAYWVPIWKALLRLALRMRKGRLARRYLYAAAIAAENVYWRGVRAERATRR